MSYVINSENTLVITGDRNAVGKRDFTGAFDPEAKLFMRLYNISSNARLQVNFGNPGFESVKRRTEVINFITNTIPNNELGCLAIFCHGLTDKIEVGFAKRHISDLVQALKARKTSKEIMILLYCCSTGGTNANSTGDNTFADLLRDALCREGFVNCRVLAHTVAGHATRNPMKRFFDGMGSPVGGTGGTMIVSPNTQKTLFAKWRAALTQADLFRFKFVTMSIADIHTHLLRL
jgi:hypothetical protein